MPEKTATKILIAMDWYRPAHRAGGPITSIENLVNLLGDEPHLEFYVVCGVFDYGEQQPLDVPQETWVKLGKAHVQYWHPKRLGWKQWMQIYRSLKPDVIHIQGLWSPKFSILPLLAAQRYKKSQLIVSPRGMLSEVGGFKGYLKIITFKLFLFFGLFKNVKLHFTSIIEKQDFQELGPFTEFGNNKISLIYNVVFDCLTNKDQSIKIPKITGQLHWIYVGRMTKDKNLKFLLDSLNLIDEQTNGLIVGAFEPSEYSRTCLKTIEKLRSKHHIEHFLNLDNAELRKYIRTKHFLISTSTFENFGHVIAEALLEGTPVVVAGRTPWQDLTEDKLGLNAELNLSEFTSQLKTVIALNQDEYNIRFENVLNYKYKNNNEQLKSQYVSLYEKKKKKILILYDFFHPAYKAGGIIQSLKNLFDLFGGEDYFQVITGVNDIDATPVDANGDLLNGVVYLKNKNMLLRELIACDWNSIKGVYFNGVFSLNYFLLPLIYMRIVKRDVKLFIAPRGMLQAGALEIKSRKKRGYLFLLKKFKLFNNVTWHATDSQEKIDIRNIVEGAIVKVVSNVPKKPADFVKNLAVGSSQPLKLIYLSLITEKKNLDLVLNALVEIPFPVVFDIFGSVKDVKYWQHCLKLINSLPKNVSCNYRGAVKAEYVQKVLSDYHALLLPSRGENFGHAIYECLSVGRPVIIGKNTPWKSIQELKAGWIVDLNSESIVESIKELNHLDQEEYNLFCSNALTAASDYFNPVGFKGDYCDLFESNNE